MENTRTRAGGLSISWILFIVFLILKLTHVIDWSWWWITSPLWIPVAIIIFIALIILGAFLATRNWIVTYKNQDNQKSVKSENLKMHYHI